MSHIDINLLINMVSVIASICFFIAKLDAMTKANRQFYETSIENLHDNINEKFDFLDSNMSEKFRLVDERFMNVSDHVRRLEHKQEESNKVKERLAIVEYTVKMMTGAANRNGLEDIPNLKIDN